MNSITVTGTISNCRFSHAIGQVTYSRCQLLAGENIIELVYKDGLSSLVQNDTVKTIVGQIRCRNNDGHTSLYVSTYLDQPEEKEDNLVLLDGIIVKKDQLYTYPNGKSNQHIMIKNVIESNDKQFITTVPCIARNGVAHLTDSFEVGQHVQVKGKLISRSYVKNLSDSEQEIKVTHEVLVEEIYESQL